jgi:hypothetical protein
MFYAIYCDVKTMYCTRYWFAKLKLVFTRQTLETTNQKEKKGKKTRRPKPEEQGGIPQHRHWEASRR